MRLHLQHVNHSSDLFYLLLLLLSKPTSNRSCVLSSQKLKEHKQQQSPIRKSRAFLFKRSAE